MQILIFQRDTCVFGVSHCRLTSTVSAASNIALIHDDAHRALLLSRAKDKGVAPRTTASWLQAWRSTISCPETKQAESDLAREKERL